MKTLCKWAFRAFIVFVVLLVAAVLLLDPIVRSLAEARLRTVTGLDVRIGRLDIGLLRPQVTLENFIVFNPAELGGSPMIEMPELHVEYDRPALQSGLLHLKLIRFNLAEVNLVTGKDGKSNFDGLKAAMGTRPKAEQQKQFAGIDTLNLTLGKLRLLDMNKPKEAREFNVGLKNEIVTGLKTEQDFQTKLLPVLLKATGNILSNLFQPQPGAVPPPLPVK